MQISKQTDFSENNEEFKKMKSMNSTDGDLLGK